MKIKVTGHYDSTGVTTVTLDVEETDLMALEHSNTAIVTIAQQNLARQVVQSVRDFQDAQSSREIILAEY